MKNPYLLLVLATLFWAGNFILSKAVSAEVPPIALAFWRWGMAFLLITVVSFSKFKRDWGLIKKHLPVLSLISLFGVAAFNTLIYLGLQHTTALNSLLLQSFFPIVVALLSFVWMGEKLRALQILGIVISLLGTLLLVAQGKLSTLLSAAFNQGDLWVMVAVFCYALYALLLRYRPPVHAFSFLIATFGLGTLMLLPFYLWEHQYVQKVHWQWNAIMTVAYLAVFPSLVSYLFFNEAVRKIGANTAGLFSHLVPLFGSIMAIVFLGEPFFRYHAIGAAFTFAGIYLVVANRSSKALK